MAVQRYRFFGPRHLGRLVAIGVVAAALLVIGCNRVTENTATPVPADPTGSPTVTATPEPPTPTPTPTPSPTPTPTSTPTPLQLATGEFLEIFEELRPAIVGVTSGSMEGTGFIVNLTLGGRATVITSASLVGGENIVVVADDQEYDAELLGAEEGLDLAVVRFCCTLGLSQVEIGRQDDLPVGSFAMSVAFAPESDSPMVRSGNVTGSWTEQNSDRDIIETDIQIESRTVGGPLFAPRGRVAGMVTLTDVVSVSGEPVTGSHFAVALDALWWALPTSLSDWGAFGEQEPEGATESETSSLSGKPLDADAVYGGVLQVAYTGEGSFSTWEGDSDIASQTMHPLHNMLIQPRTWGDHGVYGFFELRPDLAEGWRVSADGLEYAFTLREGNEWSDGTPMTCSDVKWSFDTIRTGEGLEVSPRAIYFNGVETITCADDRTVVFVLNRPSPAILDFIALPQNIIRPAHIYEEADLDLLREELPTVTSGAFRVAQWHPGESYVFERNDNYWDEPLPYLDGIELHLMNRDAFPAALRTGRLHIGSTVGFSGGDADELTQECGEDACQFWDSPIVSSSLGSALFLNKDREPWNDPAVGEAIALALDNREINLLARNDWAEMPTGCGFYPESQWAMPIDRCGAIPGYGDVMRTSTPESDLRRAKQIMAAAGYGPGDLTLELSVWQPIENDYPALALQLGAIGISVEANILDSGVAYGVWAEGDYDIGLHGFGMSSANPEILLREHFYTGGSRNYGRYSNPEFDDLVDRLSMTRDLWKRKNLGWDAMEIALNDQAKIIILHGQYMAVTGAAVRGFLPAPDFLARYGPLNRYDQVWLGG